MSEDAAKNGNNTTALAKLLNQLNLPTLLLIAVTGGGNLLATKQTGDEGRAEAIRQIRDLHNALDEFEKRQKTVLDNQEQILRNDSTILQILREGQK